MLFVLFATPTHDVSYGDPNCRSEDRREYPAVQMSAKHRVENDNQFCRDEYCK